VATSSGGMVNVFDVNSRVPLRRFAGHTRYTASAIATPYPHPPLAFSPAALVRRLVLLANVPCHYGCYWRPGSSRSSPPRSSTPARSASHCAKFSSGNTQVFSCGDDSTVRLWDLPTEEEVMVMRGHEDYVRCGVWCFDPLSNGCKMDRVTRPPTRVASPSPSLSDACAAE